mgnify:CR=1 FL=1
MSECMLATQSDAPVRLAAASPEIVLGDPKANAAAAISAIRRAEKAEADYLVLPELFLCGATLGSLMEHPLMLNACREALGAVAEATKHTWLFVSIGLPYMVDGRVRSCIALLRGGRIYAVIPASRGAANPFGFAPAVPRGAASLSTLTPPRLSVGFAGQIFAKGEPREGHIMLLSGAINATAKSYGAVRSSLAAYSARTGMAAAMALPSRGESTTAFVFDGYCAIAANGEILAESEPLSRDAFVYADVCIDKLSAFEPFTEAEEEGYVSNDPDKAQAQLRRLFALQRAALVRRAEHIHAKGFVIGVSGGLDSALALLVACAAADEMGIGRGMITGVSMPGFGTTDRTYDNAVELIQCIGATFREIDIRPACLQHMADIGHDPILHDVTYENTQARERTQILMDLANKEGGILVGTGDLSELALGWCTYNADHMSMYGVNCGVPKTLVRHLVENFAAQADARTARVLRSVLDTPVSPELLPPDEVGQIAQKTEEKIGPYELHDFFLYHFLRFGTNPQKLLFLAKRAFGDQYTQQQLTAWLRLFLTRFFQSQFKRSCLPDGPKVGSVSLSPRGDWRMPSDAQVNAWLDTLENKEAE